MKATILMLFLIAGCRCYGPEPPDESIKACIDAGRSPAWVGSAMGSNFECKEDK